MVLSLIMFKALSKMLLFAMIILFWLTEQPFLILKMAKLSSPKQP